MDKIISQFISERCVVKQNCAVTRLELYLEFLNFLKENNDKLEFQIAIYPFIDEIQKRGFIYENLIFYGINLKSLYY